MGLKLLFDTDILLMLYEYIFTYLYIFEVLHKYGRLHILASLVIITLLYLCFEGPTKPNKAKQSKADQRSADMPPL